MTSFVILFAYTLKKKITNYNCLKKLYDFSVRLEKIKYACNGELIMEIITSNNIIMQLSLIANRYYWTVVVRRPANGFNLKNYNSS